MQIIKSNISLIFGDRFVVNVICILSQCSLARCQHHQYFIINVVCDAQAFYFHLVLLNCDFFLFSILEGHTLNAIVVSDGKGDKIRETTIKHAKQNAK